MSGITNAVPKQPPVSNGPAGAGANMDGAGMQKAMGGKEGGMATPIMEAIMEALKKVMSEMKGGGQGGGQAGGQAGGGAAKGGGGDVGASQAGGEAGGGAQADGAGASGEGQSAEQGGGESGGGSGGGSGGESGGGSQGGNEGGKDGAKGAEASGKPGGAEGGDAANKAGAAKTGGAEGSAESLVPPEVETGIQMLMSLRGDSNTSDADKAAIDQFIQDILKEADGTGNKEFATDLRDTLNGGLDMLGSDRDIAPGDLDKLDAIVNGDKADEAKGSDNPMVDMAMSHTQQGMSGMAR